MKHLYVILITLLSQLLAAQFSGIFAPGNWGTVTNNSNGNINTSGAPAAISITSGDNLSFAIGTHDFTITIPQTGQITFNWNYVTTDAGPQYDYPMYVLNGVATMLNGFTTVSGNTQSGSQPCINVTAGDQFRLRMHTTDNIGGPATTTFSSFSFITGTVAVSPLSPSVCPGTTLALTASGGSNYQWSGGITNGIAFTPTATTVYTVSSGSGGCISSQTVPVVVYPHLAVSPIHPTICLGTTVTLNASGGTGYSWNTGPTTNTLAVSPGTTTNYTVAGTTTNNCSSQVTVTVDIVPGLPTLTVVNSSSGSGVCPLKSTTLTASGAVTYTWSGGITNGVGFVPPATTVYSVTGTNACGTTTAAISVSIHPLPPVTAAASVPTLCSGISATLTGGGGVPGGYTWSNGVPNATSFSPAITSGYTVVGTSAQGCTAQAVTGITVTPTPSLAPVISPTLICAGKSATVTATGATNYSWSTTQTTSSVVLSPVVTTTYSVTKWNSNCIDTKTFSVFVNQPPTVLTSANPTTICAQQTTTLDAYGGTGYTWTPYGGNLSQAIVSAAANIIFTVTVSDGTCVNTAQVPISVNPLPVISMVASSPSLCADQSVTLSVSGTDTYSWTNPTGLGTATTIVDTPAGNMSYQVTGTNTLTGCSSSTSAIVQVWARPTLTVAASKTLVCIGGPSTLTVKGAAHTFQWLHNAVTTTATIVNPLTTTVYSVTGTNTAYPCSSTSMITVSVFQPTFSVNSPTSSCAGGTIVLMASGANTYTWQTIPPQPFANIAVSPPGPTVYPVVATSILSGVTCTSSGQVNVSIYNNPAVTAAPSRTQICTKSETVELHASGAVSYTWNTQQTGGTVTTGPLTGQTVYTVTGTDQNGCMGTTTVMVKTSGCVGIGENEGMGQLLIYPNPSNGAFVISSPADMSLIMVNELGQLVRTIELNAMNNREVSVTDLASGVYIISSVNQVMRQKVIITR